MQHQGAGMDHQSLFFGIKEAGVAKQHGGAIAPAKQAGACEGGRDRLIADRFFDVLYGGPRHAVECKRSEGTVRLAHVHAHAAGATRNGER
jgi:hypothetical protein